MYEKFYVHKIAGVNLSKIYFLKHEKITCKPNNNRDLNRDWIIHIFRIHFAINLLYLHNLKTNTKNMEQQPYRAGEQIQNKNKTKSRKIQIDHAYLLYALNGIIKGWLHCLTSESKGRFLVNDILIFGSAWCLVMAEIQFSLIKKTKIGRPEHC